MKKPKITAIESFRRQCLFCNDDLPFNCHKLRKYCPQKYGVNNYCKEHFSDVAEQAEMAGEKVVRSLRDDPGESEKSTLREDLEKMDLNQINSTEIKPEPQPKKKDPIVNTVDRDKNLKLVDSLMVDKIELEIEVDLLIKQGYKIPVYDKKKMISNTNRFYLELGDYGLFWHKKNKITIINLNEILWLS